MEGPLPVSWVDAGIFLFSKSFLYILKLILNFSVCTLLKRKEETMKNYLWISIVTGCLVLGTLFLLKLETNEQHIEAQTNSTNFDIELQTVQPVFTEQMQEIGTLQPHVAFAIADESATHYVLQFGQTKVFVEKATDILKTESAKLQQARPLTDIVKVVNKATVYERPDTASHKLAELRAGFRYPVVKTHEEWYEIELGEHSGYIAKQNTLQDTGIPVLVYHHILPKHLMTTAASTISQESFSEQMRYLHSAQFTTITTEQLAKYLQGEIILPNQSVLITFDDGLLSTKEYAYPILKDYHFSAVQHIISSRITSEENERSFISEGPLQFFTQQEMAQLADVFYYEAHTHDLHRLEGGHGAALSLTATQIDQDLQQNITQLGHVTSIAYPYGHYNEAFIEAAKRTGIALGFTTNVGYANIKASPYEIGRLGMTEKTTFEQFTSYVKGEFAQQ